MNDGRPMKVCYFYNPDSAGKLGCYEISTPNPSDYFAPVSRGRVLRRSRFRVAQAKLAALRSAEGLDGLYRSRDPEYMRFTSDFVDQYRDADIIVMATYNPIHPEILRLHLSKPVKILGFVDDPYSTYVRGIPFLWAFDGAFFVSPSYSEDFLFADALKAWGCPATHWLPLAAETVQLPQDLDAFYSVRDIDLVYIGASYGNKIDRLVSLKKHFGERLRVHGRWGLYGHVGWIRGVLGKPIYPHRVTPLSNAERSALYRRCKIGINMHLSNVPTETGNMRMYEVTGHGSLLMCDKAARGAHSLIFRPDEEAVFYESINDAIEKIEYYLAHPAERIAIARAGCERTHREYDRDRLLLGLLDWARTLKTI